MSDDEVLLRIQGLTKSFGGALALDGVDLEVLPGEVHGLLGENGSGKSTLIKVLAGYYQPEVGTMYVNGEQVSLPLQPGQAQTLGMEFVHQDLGLVPSLSVAENLLMGEIAKPTHRFFMSWSRVSREVEKVFAQYGLDLDPFAMVESLRPVERALLAIVRALEGLRKGADGRPTLLVLDEPTVFLPQHEVALLFDFVRHIADGGSSVLFVSHDLDEVRDITNRITVLRDGHVAGVVQTVQTSRVDLVHLILGHNLTTMEPQVDVDRQDSGCAVLQVRDMTTRWLEDVSFELYQGEVLGLTGLVGSGYEDIVYALFGAQPATSGTVRFGQRQPVPASELNPRKAMERGLALVPGDRQSTGSLPSLSAAENINLLVLDKFFTSLRLRRGDLMRNAEQLMHTFDVRPARPELEYGSFSGGNQQKAMMAKWQQLDPGVLLLHEPTQGVDVGARQQIWQMIRDTTDVSSTICASSDYEQLAAICDRVGVVARGRLVGYVTGEDLTKEGIAAFCLRSSKSVASVVGGFDITGMSDDSRG